MSEFLTLQQVAAQFPGSRGAAHPSLVTITRWIVDGVPAVDGKRVKLAATRAGHRWLTKQSDLNIFFAALRGESMPTPDETPSTAKQRKAAERANRELEAAGA